MQPDPILRSVIKNRALVGMILAIVCTIPDFVSSREPRTLYIAPSSAGTGNGSTWSNAGSIENLSKFIAMAGPGGRVLLRADAGPFRTSRPITIRAGGTNDAFVTIAGADSSGEPA